MNSFKKTIKNISVLFFLLKPLYYIFLDFKWFFKSKIFISPVFFDEKNLLYPNSHISKLIYLYNFEYEEREFLKKNLDINLNVVNIGANVGLYTILCGCLANQGTIYAFEPDSENFLKLKENILLNNLNNIVVHNCALGSENKKMILYRDSLNPNLDSHYSLLDKSKSHKDIIGEIDCFTLDSIYKNWNKNIDILIMDVEGFEKEVLVGAKEFLKDNSNCLFMIEVTNNHEFIFNYMKQFNLNPFILLNNSLIPINWHHGNVFFKNN